jgi:flagellar protein FlaG
MESHVPLFRARRKQMEIRQIQASATPAYAQTDKLAPKSTLPPGSADAVRPKLNVKATGTKEDVDDAVKKANDFLAQKASALEFSVDESTGTTVVKLVDTQTKEILRQYPTEEMLAISKDLMDFQKSMLLSEKI